MEQVARLLRHGVVVEPTDAQDGFAQVSQLLEAHGAHHVRVFVGIDHPRIIRIVRVAGVPVAAIPDAFVLAADASTGSSMLRSNAATPVRTQHARALASEVGLLTLDVDLSHCVVVGLCHERLGVQSQGSEMRQILSQVRRQVERPPNLPQPAAETAAAAVLVGVGSGIPCGPGGHHRAAQVVELVHPLVRRVHALVPILAVMHQPPAHEALVHFPARGVRPLAPHALREVRLVDPVLWRWHLGSTGLRSTRGGVVLARHTGWILGGAQVAGTARPGRRHVGASPERAGRTRRPLRPWAEKHRPPPAPGKGSSAAARSPFGSLSLPGAAARSY